MKDLPENELLSAYLDGELTAAEQADVERLLARDPAARQLLEELRALSSTLQALPQHTLADDLGEWVLRTAERRMLTAPAATDEADAAEDGGEAKAPAEPAAEAAMPRSKPAQPAATLGTTIVRRLLSSRALAWSALAVAVAVMLTVAENDRRNPPADNEIARSSDAVTHDKRDAETGEGAPKVGGESRIPSISAAEGGGSEKAGDSINADTPAAVAKGGLPSGEGDVATPVRPGAESPGPAQTLSDNLGSTPEGVPLPAASDPMVPEPAGRDAAPGRDVRGAAASGMGGMGGGMMGGGMMGGGAMGGRGGRGGAMAGTRGGGARGGIAAPAARDTENRRGGAVGEVPSPSNLAIDLAAKTAGQTTDGYAIIRCDLSPEAFLSRDFDRLLAANGITFVEVAPDAALPPGGQVARQTIADGVTEGQPIQAADATDTLSQQQAGRRTNGQFTDGSVQNGPLDLVCVEATPEQIEATLAALDLRSNEVLSLDVTPAIGEGRQAGWSDQYSRAARRETAATSTPELSRTGGFGPAEAANGRPEGAMGTAQNDSAEEGRRGVAWRVAVSPSQTDWANRLRTGVGGVAPSEAPAQTPTGAEESPPVDQVAEFGVQPTAPPPEAEISQSLAVGRGAAAGRGGMAGGRALGVDGTGRTSPSTFGAAGMGQAPGAMETATLGTPTEPAAEEGNSAGTDRPVEEETTYRVLFVLRMASPGMPASAASMGAMGGAGQAPQAAPAAGNSQ